MAAKVVREPRPVGGMVVIFGVAAVEIEHRGGEVRRIGRNGRGRIGFHPSDLIAGGAAADRGNAQDEIEILPPLEVFGELAGAERGLAAHRNSRSRLPDLAREQGLEHLGIRVEPWVAAFDVAAPRGALIGLDVAVDQQVEPGTFAKGGDDRRQLVGKIIIVAVEKGQERCARFVDAAIARGIAARVARLPEEADAGVGDAFDHRRGAVARPVVDDDQFEVSEALPQYAGDGALDHVGAVEHRHDDRDGGRSQAHRRASAIASKRFCAARMQSIWAIAQSPSALTGAQASPSSVSS